MTHEDDPKTWRMPTEKEFQDCIDRLVEEGTPLPENQCKNDACRADKERIVQRVRRIVCCHPEFDDPYCEGCGRVYPNADRAIAIGFEEYWREVEEFRRLMNTPVTI